MLVTVFRLRKRLRSKPSAVNPQSTPNAHESPFILEIKFNELKLLTTKALGTGFSRKNGNMVNLYILFPGSLI